jgi:hypothetical protein
MALTELWVVLTRKSSKKSVLGILSALSEDMKVSCQRSSLWIGLAALLFTILPASAMRWPTDFPDIKFPVKMASKHEAILASGRVLTRDQWADYLIYRYYPHHRVFIDGRSDFYGEMLGRQYQDLVQARPKWEEVLESYRFSAILAPTEWGLVPLLKKDVRWRIVDDDGMAVLFERVAAF